MESSLLKDSGERLARELDWNLLRTFMVVVQEGSVTGAAKRLYLRQPTISHALKRLETRLGKRLIERGPATFRVTPAGEVLYRECVEIYGNVVRVAVLTRDIKDEIAGHVRIAMASHVISPIFDEVLAAFHVANPKATYEIEVDTSAEVTRAVLEKSVSFGVCLVHRRSPRLEYEMIYREYFGFFCGPSHPLFGQSGLKLEDLKGHAAVSFKTDQLADALRPVALLRAQHDIDDIVVGHSSHLEEVRRMIVAGLGIGPLPIHVVARDLRDGLLWRLPPYKAPPAIDIYVVWNPHTHLNRAEEGLLAALRAAIDAKPLSARTYK
ncbi:LysR family transcriptional regulator [Pelagibius litoralis]|uniref:LysR family transcriptional regulator n=2 Tax=Pelagibius litoralis TaxID=374515 RepID=A0A967KCY0_9PROT|nr:LysR family transcriptional regulator [Pelagibius litoralis]